MLPKLCIIIGISNPTWPQEITTANLCPLSPFHTHTCTHTDALFKSAVLQALILVNDRIIHTIVETSDLKSPFIALFHIPYLIHQQVLTFGSVQFSHSVVSNSLWPRRLQHSRLPCPSPTSGACSNSCPLSR